MYCSLTWTRTIMRCFHKTVPQGFHRCNKPRVLPQTAKNFVLSRVTLQQISLNIFSGLISQEKLKNFVSSFAVSTISLLSIVLLLIAGNRHFPFVKQAIILVPWNVFSPSMVSLLWSTLLAAKWINESISMSCRSMLN